MELKKKMCFYFYLIFFKCEKVLLKDNTQFLLNIHMKYLTSNIDDTWNWNNYVLASSGNNGNAYENWTEEEKLILKKY